MKIKVRSVVTIDVDDDGIHCGDFCDQQDLGTIDFPRCIHFDKAIYCNSRLRYRRCEECLNVEEQIANGWIDADIQ